MLYRMGNVAKPKQYCGKKCDGRVGFHSATNHSDAMLGERLGQIKPLLPPINVLISMLSASSESRGNPVQHRFCTNLAPAGPFWRNRQSLHCLLRQGATTWLKNRAHRYNVKRFDTRGLGFGDLKCWLESCRVPRETFGPSNREKCIGKQWACACSVTSDKDSRIKSTHVQKNRINGVQQRNTFGALLSRGIPLFCGISQGHITRR